MKQCSKCKKYKSYDCYHIDKKSKDGYFGYCKKCRKIDDGVYYLNSDKKRKKLLRDQKLRRIISIVKRINGCCFCNEKEPCCLDFHHLRDKEFNISPRVSWNWEKTKEEIRKCVVICANCHRKLHAGLLVLECDE